MLVVAGGLAAASVAGADPVKCERSITAASAKFAQTKAKVLQSCEDKKAAGRLVATTDCHADVKTAASIQKAVGQLGASVAKDCGGRDKTCGTADDDALPTIGWGAIGACPNFEGGSCAGPIADCNGIADCIACVDEAAVDQAITLYYGALDDGQFGTRSAVNKCQQTIGKETTKFLQAKSKALQKCWDARLKGKHTNACPDPGDGKAAPAIAKAEGKKVAAICKACGGPDKACGGGDDLTPAAIGFASTCPDVTVPGDASSCGGAILDLQDVVACVDCVTEFKVDCMDRLAVPQFVPYPPECAGSTSSTTTPTTSSTTTSTGPGTCGNGVVDPGEPCDPSSPGGVFLCAPGEVCTAACTCASTTTTTPTTSSTTSTTAPSTCGNGVVDPGEPCDPSSPNGAFLCAPGEVCTAGCTCASTSTTSTTSASTTSNPPTTTTSSTSSSTSSTTLNTCGNGIVDPGEPCDPSSPNGAFLCAPGEVCTAACTCASTSTTTTAPTTSTSTTVPSTCGNGVVDPGEPCDASSPNGAFLCAPGEVCNAACMCVPTTTSTSSTEAPTTTLPPTTVPTSTATSSTVTTTSTSSTTTTLPYGSPSRAFLTDPGGLLD